MKGVWSATVLISVVLAGCVSTQEMPLAPNVVRIDTQAKGVLFTGQAVPQTMRAAAQATLARGYSHFKFAGTDVQQGSVETGAVANDNDTGAPSGLGTVTALHDLTANSTATVLMFHADDPEAKGAFNAAQVIKLYRW
jgi:hypothetical protein